MHKRHKHSAEQGPAGLVSRRAVLGAAAAAVGVPDVRKRQLNTFQVYPPSNPVPRDSMELFWFEGGPAEEDVYAYVWDWGDGSEVDVYPAGVNGATHVFSTASGPEGYYVSVTAIRYDGGAPTASVNPNVQVPFNQPSDKPRVMNLSAKERKLAGDPELVVPTGMRRRVRWRIDRRDVIPGEAYAWNWDYKFLNMGFGSDSEMLTSDSPDFDRPTTRLVTARITRPVARPGGGTVSVQFLLKPRRLRVRRPT